MPIVDSIAKIGVYADVPNLYRTGGQRLQYDVLRAFACRDAAEPVRLCAYVTYDIDRARRDAAYRNGALSFHSKLRDYGYKVVLKEVTTLPEMGDRSNQTTASLALAIDALQQSERLDRILIASGDPDMTHLIRALQNRGCRVEVVALANAGEGLREEADHFISGFLIPGMVPIGGRPPAGERRKPWGEVGSRVRGWAYWYEHERSFGYMRFLQDVGPGLWLTDARDPDSPYGTAFFRAAQLPSTVARDLLPGRAYVFEFELAPSERGDGLQALDVQVVSTLPSVAARRVADPGPSDSDDLPVVSRSVPGTGE